MSNISSLWKIAKKWLETGKLDSVDALRAGGLIFDELNKATKYDHNGKLKRKDFSKTTQKITLIKQAYKCKECKNKLDVVNFDHVDGNRSNNSITNCQALCPNCHAKKTRES